MRVEMILKNRLKEERINFGISQKELAQLVGVSRQTINSIENEQFYPTTKLSLIICEVFFASLFCIKLQKLL